MTQTTTLTRIWAIKMLAFCAVLLGFGAWGLYDAMQVYPKRGRTHATYSLYKYLEQTKIAQNEPGGDPRALERAGVSDPQAELASLSIRSKELRPVDAAKFAWLSSLNLVGALDQAKLEGVDTARRFEELDKEWKQSGGAPKDAPPALNPWDIPVQWVFVVVGLGGGLALLFHFFRVKSIHYGWDEAEQRLYLPDSSTLVPADIEDFDKRKWDKYIIFLKVKPGHEKHGGKELRLDLLHHTPLEEWVLAMERTAFPDRAREEDEEEGEAESEPPVPEGGDEEPSRSATSA